MDDATSELYSAFLVEEEGTQSSFRALAEVIAAHGLPCALYTDRASHYFHTPKAGAKVAKDQLTQVGRALAQLGIEHIPAYSPEARGRSERAFGTLQDRLPKELALAGITTIEAANRFLARSTCPSTTPASRSRPSSRRRRSWPTSPAPIGTSSACRRSAWSATTTRVRYRGSALQIPPSPLRPHFVKAKVRVHDYPDGTLAVFHGPRCLARYRADGTLLDADRMLAA